MGKLLNRSKKYWSIGVVILFLLTVLIYVLINQENIYIQVHDNLDSNVVWYKMVVDRGLFFSSHGEIGFLGGIDRSSLCSVLSPISWLYYLFPAFAAYIIMFFLRILMSVYGWCKVTKLIMKDDRYFNISVLCGLIYGMLPFFPSSGFGFASLPLLLYILIQTERRGKVCDFIHLFLYPILSSFATFGMFICGYLLLAFIYRSVTQRKVSWRLLIALAVISVGYVAMSFKLFSGAVSGGATIRKEFSHSYYGSLGEYLNTVKDVYINSQEHSGSLHKYIVMPVCISYFVVHNYNNLKAKAYKRIFTSPFNLLMAATVFNAAVYGLENVGFFKETINYLIPYLNGYNFGRILWLSPFIWYFAFFIALCRLYEFTKNGKAMTMLCIAAALLVVFTISNTYNDIEKNVNMVIDKIVGRTNDSLTYGEFYSTDLFDKIKEDIGYDYEYSAAFGMHPAVLEYNGIATIDGYKSTMSLDYKYAFREVIAPSLEKSSRYRSYFDTWGGRAYLFSSNVTYDPVRKMNKNRAELLINPDAFRALGGKYIFSRVIITNVDDIEVSFVGHYQDDSSPYDIYVYKMKEAK